MSGQYDIDLAVIADGWPDAAAENARSAASAALAAEPGRLLGRDGVSLCIALHDDDGMRELNSAYRGKDRATNVLSFPSGVLEGGTDGLPPDAGTPLGDVVLGLETVLAEAERDGKGFVEHVAHLTVHGTLHLLGYDHETEAEAEAMEARERAILNDMGIADPYAVDRLSIQETRDHG